MTAAGFGKAAQQCVVARVQEQQSHIIAGLTQTFGEAWQQVEINELLGADADQYEKIRDTLGDKKSG